MMTFGTSLENQEEVSTFQEELFSPFGTMLNTYLIGKVYDGPVEMRKYKISVS